VKNWRVFLIVFAMAWCGRSFAASGVWTEANGTVHSVASSSCADVRAGFNAQFPSAVVSCSSDPIVVGSVVFVQWSASSASGVNVATLTATSSAPVSTIPTDSASLYVIVLAGLLVGVFALGYQNGVTQ